MQKGTHTNVSRLASHLGPCLCHELERSLAMKFFLTESSWHGGSERACNHHQEMHFSKMPACTCFMTRQPPTVSFPDLIEASENAITELRWSFPTISCTVKVVEDKISLCLSTSKKRGIPDLAALIISQYRLGIAIKISLGDPGAGFRHTTLRCRLSRSLGHLDAHSCGRMLPD